MGDERDDAKRVLATRPRDSIVFAGTFAGGLAVVLGVGLVAIQGLGWLTQKSFFLTCAFWAAASLVAWVVHELLRLAERGPALRAVLQAGKNYEALITEAREERDEAVEKLEGVRADYRMLLASQRLVAEIERAVLPADPALPPVTTPAAKGKGR